MAVHATIFFKAFQFTPLREGRHVSHNRINRFLANFNSRPSARGDTRRLLISSRRNYFNSRPSARGDTRKTSKHRKNNLFQFTPLREGRLCRGLLFCTAPYFNSRPSARGDLLGNGVELEDDAFQFTPLREGRRRALVVFFPHCYISIHAPPRGATAKDMQFLQIFCSTLTNQHGLTIMPRNLSRLFW